jgi:hypothetical protein
MVLTFLQRFAVKLAVVLPIVGVAGCISYIVAGSTNKPRLKSQPVISLTREITAVNLEHVDQPEKQAIEAVRQAATLRDAMDGPKPRATFTTPKPRLKILNPAAR